MVSYCFLLCDKTQMLYNSWKYFGEQSITMWVTYLTIYILWANDYDTICWNTHVSDIIEVYFLDDDRPINTFT
jgi:hypothetical protein